MKLRFLAVLAGALFWASLGWARVDLNTATPAELDALKGIGPAKAQAIVEYRRQHGPFRSVDELQNVPGIGPATLKDLRRDVTVGGGRESHIPRSAERADKSVAELKRPAVPAMPGPRPAAADVAAPVPQIAHPAAPARPAIPASNRPPAPAVPGLVKPSAPVPAEQKVPAAPARPSGGPAPARPAGL
jgi:competence protein ComEA